MGFSHPWKASQEFLEDPQKRGGLVESVIASHMERLFGSFLYYWKNHFEVDLIAYRENRLQGMVEVKYQSQIPGEAIRQLGGNGGGIIVSAQDLRYDRDYNVAILPAPHFLLTI